MASPSTEFYMYTDYEFYLQPRSEIISCSDYEFYCEIDDCERMDCFRSIIKRLIKEDKKEELVNILKTERGKDLVDLFKPDSELSIFILGRCIEFDAINCTKALLQGETGLTLEFEKFEFFPLHFAAEKLSSKLTKYLLKFGFRANEKVCYYGSCLLPVDVALHSLRRSIFWEEGQSLFSLIVKLTVEGMYDPIATILLLMNHLSKLEASEVVCRYATEGKTFELAALLLGLSEIDLMVDDLYMPSNLVSSGERLTLRQNVVNQIVMLENELAKLLPVDKTKLDEYRKMKTSMMSVLMLLEIFLRSEDEIAELVRKLKPSCPKPAEMPDLISNVFKNLDFKLTARDAAYFRKPLGFARNGYGNFHMKKKRQQSDELPYQVQHFFPSGLPPLSSFPAVADFGWDETDPKNDKLVRAVELLSSGINASYWTPDQSIFKLIVVLCLPEMKKKLEVIRLFAQDIEKMNEIAYCFAKEGKLIQLAVILMVTWEKIRDPLLVQVKGDYPARFMTFHQFINSELAQVVDLEYRLIGRTTKQERELSRCCRERKVAMMSVLHLLEIFEKADDVQSYSLSDTKNVEKEEVVKDVMKLLAKAGFKLKSKDIEISDLAKSSKEAPLEELDEAMQELMKNAEIMTKRGSQRQDARLSYVLPCGFIVGDGAHGRANDMRDFLLRRYPRECKFLSSAGQSFRALWTSRAYCTSSRKALEVDLHKDIFRRVNLGVQKFPTSKQLASVALAVKKGIKYA